LLVRHPPSPAPTSVSHPLAPHQPRALRRGATPLRPVVLVDAPAPRLGDSLGKRAVPRLAAHLSQGQALVWPNLYFAQGKADLLPTARASLDTLVTVLRQQPSLRLQVQGHTDNQGDSTLNRQLSQQRAEAVCRYLIAGGITHGRLQAKGYGGSRPVADNRAVALRARNRRVVLQPLP
ncbi:MAG: OmpA family protein, partial [Hymenobacter sp.]